MNSQIFFNVCKRKKLKILDYGKKARFLKISSLKKEGDGFEYEILLRNKAKKFLQKQYLSMKFTIKYVL